MKEFWNNRYAATDYAYGTEPNQFFKNQLQIHQPTGKLLCPAEGEGRNAVYAAQQGLEVTAFDISEAGRTKAQQLAAANGVRLAYLVGSLDELKFEQSAFDALALIYAHFPAADRSRYHKELARLLKPGAYVFLEAFAKPHLDYRQKNPAVGGPGEVDMLLAAEELQQDFQGFDLLLLEEGEVELNEGAYHQGTGFVVRFVGQKII